MCFEERKWKMTGIFPEYFHQKIILRNLTSIRNEELVGYIIQGISDKRIQDIARVPAPQTEEDLLRAFVIISLREETAT